MIVSKLKLVAIAVPALALTVACAWSLARQAPAPGDRAEGKAESPARNPNPAADRKTPEGAERFALGNGLTVFLRPIQGAKEVDLIVLYSVGSDHDPEGQTGLGHMVEHLYLTAAAGTAKARTIQQFAFRYPKGANGQTGHRYTVLSTSFDAKDLDEELRDAAARMSDLRITAADLNRERERLLEEVDNMFGFMPALGAMNHARELARPTPGGGRHGGLPEHVRKFTVQDVQAHWARYYKPSNAIIGLAGAIDPATARKAIETHFGKLAPGEKLPAPREPGAPKLGTVKEVTVEPDGVEIEPTDRSKRPKVVEEPIEPGAEPHVCIAYPAPRPDSDLYAPFLVLVMRLWAGASKLGDGGPTGSPVYFTPLDDGSVVAITASAKRGEPAAKAIAKLEAFVADTLAPKLEKGEADSVREQFGLFFGTVKIPDEMLAQNPYGAVFSMARREQLGIDPHRISKALSAVTEQSLRRAAKEIFAPDRHAAALVKFRE